MQLSREEIVARLKEILASADPGNRALTEGCTEDSKLITDLGFTSVSMLYMVIAMEETFGIRFDNLSVSDFETIGDVVNCVEEKLK